MNTNLFRSFVCCCLPLLLLKTKKENYGKISKSNKKKLNQRKMRVNLKEEIRKYIWKKKLEKKETYIKNDVNCRIRKVLGFKNL